MLNRLEAEIPGFIKSHNGKVSDSVVFDQPTKVLPLNRGLVADYKLDTKDGSGGSNSSTGSPSTNKLEKELTEPAVEGAER